MGINGGDGKSVAEIDAQAVLAAEQEDEVEAFREFLDHVSPEDFEQPGSSPSA